MGYRLTATVAALLVAVSSAACGSGDDDDDQTGQKGQSQLDLVIGSLLPLTGEQSPFGTPWQKASDVAVAQINEAIQESGADHTVEIVHEDTQGDPQSAVQSARKVGSQGASCISGPSSSAEAIPVANSASLHEGILQITTATSDEITGLTDPSGLVNRTTPPDSFQGPTIASFMDEELGGARGKTVNIAARNDAYGTGLAETFRGAWEELGGEVGAEVIYDPRQPNYDSEAQQIADGNPDAWVIIDFPETYSKVGPSLVRTGDWVADRTFTTDGLFSDDLADIATDEAVEGMRGTTPGAPDEGAASRAFDAIYTAAEPSDVDRQAFDAQVFDNVVLCYLAAVAAGSTDGEAMAAAVRDVSSAPGERFTFEELPEAIAALQDGEDIDYEGASGSIEMDENGDASAGVYDTFIYRNGSLESHSEVPVSKSPE